MEIFKDITFADPNFFWLLVLLPLMGIWYFLRRDKVLSTLNVSTLKPYDDRVISIKHWLNLFLPILRIIAIGFLIIALARPQSTSVSRNVSTDGIDIVIALDVSTSMLAEDFKPNRLEAAKKSAKKFITSRPNDRIGLVVFAGESFTQCPVTIDHDVLMNLIDDIKPGVILDGTAIGMGLATSVSRLKDSKAKSKVIILLTDGVNNTGFISPKSSAEIARTFKIRVYTIGVGSKGMAPYPFETPYGKQYRNVEVKIDEDVMKEIATLAGGKYYRATNNKALDKIYSEIDKLEKTKINVSTFSNYSEKFLPFALIALLLLLLELIMKLTLLRKFP